MLELISKFTKGKYTIMYLEILVNQLNLCIQKVVKVHQLVKHCHKKIDTFDKYQMTSTFNKHI